jgi:dCTP deaminase
MVLSDRHIRKFLEEGRIKVTPKPNLEKQLGPCTIDFHLDNIFKIFDHSKYPFIDPQNPDLSSKLMKEIRINDEKPFIMRPGEFVLTTTKEELILPDDLIGRLEGRSSLGRLGIIVHSTAARFDPGWIGKPVMELGNIGVMPVALYPGMRICSFTFEEVSSIVETPYTQKKAAKYAHQQAPDASKLAEEFGEKNKKRETKPTVITRKQRSGRLVKKTAVSKIRKI